MTPSESNSFFDSASHGSPVMVILRGNEPGAALALAERAWAAGIEMVEVPLQAERDVESLRGIVAATTGSRRTGAGTIISTDLVDRAADAGASFTVAPGWSKAVLDRSLARGLAHMPGVATGTEVQVAMAEGLTWLKAFPAAELGRGWFAAMAGPFPAARFVATGGVGSSNAVPLQRAGAAVVSLGSSFASLSDTELATLVTELRQGQPVR